MQLHVRNRKFDNKFREDLRQQVVKLEQRVLKRDKQQELDIALAEREITKFLPLNTLGEEVDFIFNDAVLRRAVSDYIWTYMEAKGKTETSINELARESMKLCFSGYMLAHMYITAGGEVKQ